MSAPVKDRMRGRTRSAFDTTGARDAMAIAWCESALTRVIELEALCEWTLSRRAPDGRRSRDDDVIAQAVRAHLDAARHAASTTPGLLHPIRSLRRAPRLERAMSNLDAAEAQLLNIAPADYLLGQTPSLLRHVQCYLIPTDPRRREFERIADELGVRTSGDSTALSANGRHPAGTREHKVEDERGRIVTAVRGASSAALREQVRVRSFRNVLAGTTLLLTLLAVAVAVMGWRWPTLMPLCFAPEESGQAIVVCPSAQSQPFPTSGQPGTDVQPADAAADIDDAVERTATPQDLMIVEFVGITAAAVAAASAVHGIRGSSERYAVPVLLILLKLPTGALTAFLGLMLMRGQFVPGLSALDTSAQILAWALVFGYGQQLFTRLVDQQGHSVLNSVRGANRPAPTQTTP